MLFFYINRNIVFSLYTHEYLIKYNNDCIQIFSLVFIFKRIYFHFVDQICILFDIFDLRM